VSRIAKITPDDYSDLLAAVDEGVSQRALARRYGCAPSLITRHVAKARRLRELRDLAQMPEVDPGVGPIEGSTHEILEARIRDPKTSDRDRASLANALARQIKDEGAPPDSPAILCRLGTLILEPGRSSPGSECRYRLMRRTRKGIEHLSGPDYDFTAAEGVYLILFTLAPQLGLTREEVLSMSLEDIGRAVGL
jgi:transposase-like protein